MRKNLLLACSHQVTFRGCPSSELLAPYSQAFRLMNPDASYLRQDPMGYHEKAFSLFLPFSLDEDEITITEDRYLPLWLDALDHPEHYDGKHIRFTDPIEIRKSEEDSSWSLGRVVMTCCMADLQFMAFGLDNSKNAVRKGWAAVDARAELVRDIYGQRKLRLTPEDIRPADPPKDPILDGRRK